MKFLSFVVLSVVVNSSLAAVPVWGQCGGRNYNGDTSCVSGTTCTVLNEWYHQCLPGSNPGPTTTQAPPNPPTTTTAPPTNTGTAPPPSGTGLHARIVAKGKLYWGSCADANLLNKAANAAILRSDFGQLTAENSMKWDALQPSRGNFNWGGADTLMNWAASNGKMVRGHTLVWHSQLPNWVNNINDASTLTTVINDHIRAVAGRWAGKIYAWDVVNEILNEDGSLRSSVFSRVLGENFVSIAFRAARAADPNAKLYINDYNLDYDNAKTRGTVGIVQRANAGGVQLIDGLGTQMHLEANGASGALAALQRLASAGSNLEVAITELDIKNAAANDYTTVLRACLQVPQCVGITSWGVSDADSWRSQNSPLLFNNNYQPKAAYNALIQALA